MITSQEPVSKSGVRTEKQRSRNFKLLANSTDYDLIYDHEGFSLIAVVNRQQSFLDSKELGVMSGDRIMIDKGLVESGDACLILLDNNRITVTDGLHNHMPYFNVRGNGFSGL